MMELDSNNGKLLDAPASLQFNDLPNESVELIMKYDLPIFDRRSRDMVQEKIRNFLLTHEHVSLVTERLMKNVCWIGNSFQQYHTFLHELKQLLFRKQLKEINKAPQGDRMRLMGLRAQENQNCVLAKIYKK